MPVYMSDLKRQSEEELDDWLNGGVVDDKLPALRGGVGDGCLPAIEREGGGVPTCENCDRQLAIIYAVTLIAIGFICALAILH